MAKQRQRDVTQRSYHKLFFVLSVVMLLATLWAFYNEGESRRPWKGYQRQFNRLERRVVEEQFKRLKEQLYSSPEYRQLLVDLRSAEQRFNAPQTRKAHQASQRLLAQLEGRLADVSQTEQFLKSEIDSIYYFEKKALHEGQKEEYQERQRQRLALETRVAALQPAIQELTRRRDATSQQLSKVTADLERLRSKKKQMETELERLERRLETISQRPLEIQQVVLRGADRNNFGEPTFRVDRCTTCHLGIDKKELEQTAQPFRNHPQLEALLKVHPVDRFGCSFCHGGQGPALDAVRAAHGELELNDQTPGTFEPLLRGGLVQSSCRSCHADVADLKGAQVLSEGEALFKGLGCFGCHQVKGFENLEKVGPDLSRIGQKVHAPWLIAWLRNPRALRPRTRMPNFWPVPVDSAGREIASSPLVRQREEETKAIAAFLLSFSQAKAGEGTAQTAETDKLVRPSTFSAGIEGGKQLVETTGCLGCHAINGRGGTFAPDLWGIAAKLDAQWIYNWIKDPKQFSLKTRMPNLRLTDREVLAITRYLMTLGDKAPQGISDQVLVSDQGLVSRGKKLVETYGCFGCHDIPGMEKMAKVGVELTAFGQKRLLELEFGDMTRIQHSWGGWTFAKLKNPRVFNNERIEGRMPNFSLTDAEAKRLQVFLRSLTGRQVPERYAQPVTGPISDILAGREVVRKYNCMGCHAIGGKGGEVRAIYPDPALAPPVLDGEGEKVQPQWLFAFLKQPIPLRPWLKIRMPTFGFSDAEASILVRFFAALGQQPVPYESVADQVLAREHLEAGRKLASKDYLDCFNCHQQGDKKPQGPPEGWAPDLALARGRLRPPWILKWLKDPQVVQPGTKMPTYFGSADSGPEDILGGDEQRQMIALRDYLLSLGRR